MTNREAIEYLKNHYLAYVEHIQNNRKEVDRHNEVMDLAIEALEKQTWHDLHENPNDLPHYEYDRHLKGLSELKERYLVRTETHFEVMYYYGYWQDQRGYRYKDVIAWKEIIWAEER